MELKIRKEESDCAEIYLKEGINGSVFVCSIVNGRTQTELLIKPDGTMHYPTCQGNFIPKDKK